MSIADELALLANTKEQIRLAVGASKAVPFSTYVDLIDGNPAPQLTVDPALIGIERQTAILANTKESLRVALGLSTSIPFSQYASHITLHEESSTVFDFVDNQYSKDQMPVNLSDISEFIRLSSATNWQGGQLVEVANNIPRISGDGLLIEPQRTNLFPEAIIYGGVGTTTTTMEIGAGNIVPAARYPSGTTSYSLYTLTRPNPCVISAYVKTSDNSEPVFTGSITGAGSDFAFVVMDEGHAGTYSVTKHADVYRVSSVSTQAQARGTVGIGKFATNSTKAVTATLCQIEEGDKLTSLILSDGTPATRAKETLIVPFTAGQTVTADKDAGVTMTIVDNTAVFEGHGYIRSIEVS